MRGGGRGIWHVSFCLVDATARETVLAERIAALLWRLQRALRYETDMIEIALQEIPQDMATAARYGERALGIPASETMTPEAAGQQVSRRLIPTDDTLAKVMRYEAHLHRQYIHTLHELEAIQFRRQGGQSPLARPPSAPRLSPERPRFRLPSVCC